MATKRTKGLVNGVSSRNASTGDQIDGGDSDSPYEASKQRPSGYQYPLEKTLCLGKFPIKYLIYTIPILPLGGLALCVAISMAIHFEDSTATHCRRVHNFLPSLSAVIGGSTPERYIFRICIAVHCFPRLLAVALYHRTQLSYAAAVCRWWYPPLVWLNSLSYELEELCLLTLAYVSSTENYAIHENSFILFMVSSYVYMLSQIIIEKYRGCESRSVTIKMRMFLGSLLFFGLAVRLFVYHMSKCRHYIYSYFAICEYILVVLNVMFHTYRSTEFIHNWCIIGGW